MSRKKIYSFVALVVVFLLVLNIPFSNRHEEDLSEKVKISLRDVGNKLLLANLDSFSLVLPVIELAPGIYQLSFQNQLSIVPDSLVSIVKKSFGKSSLKANYRVQVLQDNDLEVAYSYEMKGFEENSIIPCAGRILPNNGYSIEVKFIDHITISENELILYGSLSFSGIFLVGFLFYKKKTPIVADEKSTPLGTFKFFPEQNKLMNSLEEISLSGKESELLEIFLSHINQVVKRDFLTKKVWEDKGVFVGRSLDTYISKLRKKLKSDSSIKISNIHGVGYKLEIEV